MLASLATFAVHCQLGRSKKRPSRLPASGYHNWLGANEKNGVVNYKCFFGKLFMRGLTAAKLMLNSPAITDAMKYRKIAECIFQPKDIL
jgi:hypothetical protein